MFENINPTKESLKDGCCDVFKNIDDILLVNLFGSFARGTQRANSDIDLLIFFKEKSSLNRRSIWQLWDEKSSHLEWSNRASLVPIRYSSRLEIGTLLLDLPEEHIPLWDPKNIFQTIKLSIETWRKSQGAKKMDGFNKTHSWLYTDKKVALNTIDFVLGLPDVA